MSDNNEHIPSLTLNTEGAAAFAEAPAAPKLTLGEAAPAEKVKAEAPVEKLDIDRLSPAEQAAVREFAKQIW
jgi:hypothetical protein